MSPPEFYILMINRLSDKLHLSKKERPPKVDKCMACLTNFNLIHKQHQCKRCNRAVCSTCAHEKSIIPNFDPKIPHRICKVCKEDQSDQKRLIEREKCGFGILSDVGKRWMKQLQDDAQVDPIRNYYYSNIDNWSKSSNDEIKSQIQQNLLRVYKEVKGSLNYSLAEWHHYMMAKETDSGAQTRINRVLTAFFQKQPVKITKSLVLITMFLLYFCDESFTYTILLRLYENIIPHRFKYSNVDMDERRPIENQSVFLLEVYQTQHGKPNQSQEKSIRAFFDQFSTPMLTSLMLNHVMFTVAYSLFSSLLVQKEFHQYEKMMALMCKEHLTYIQEVGSVEDELGKWILARTSADQVIFLQTSEQAYQFSARNSQARTSISSKEDVPKTVTRPFIDEEVYPKALAALIEFMKSSQQTNLESLLSQVKNESSRLCFNELVGLIRNQKEKFEDQQRIYEEVRSKYEQQLEEAKQAKEIENELELEKAMIEPSAQQDEAVGRQKQEITENEQAKPPREQTSGTDRHSSMEERIESRSESKQEFADQIQELNKEIQKLRLENSELQQSLHQSVLRVSTIEKKTKEQQQQEMQQQIQKLNNEKQAILKKIKMLQDSLAGNKAEIESKGREIDQLTAINTELKKNNEELAQLNKEQTVLVEKLGCNIDQLKIQVAGLQRKHEYEHENRIDPGKAAFENQQQLRDTIIDRERELYALKFQFVGINQQRIKITDKVLQFLSKISVLEAENQRLKQQLVSMEARYEKSDIKKVTEYYESKIEQLQQCFEDQMQRLLSQQSVPAVPNKLPQPEKSEKPEKEGGQEDECAIF